MAETLDKTAQRIAEKGREALLERLRPAFEEAAAAHADVLELDADKLEQMVQRAADRADGLQWRRALASVATEELGIGLGEALGHPVVAKAQALVGAPSYEESLAAIVEATPTGGTETPAAPATEAVADAEPRAHADAEPATGDDLPVRVAVVHLDGLSELDEDEELELRFTEDGLDVLRAPDEAALAHFAWSEIHGVEVQPGRARMLRRRGSSTRLILSATGRHARFEARGADPEELKQRLAPALTKLGAGR
jgi:hypothetical protein